jgi:D-glucosaminate-6-phosphate ammonia-lyase
MSPSTSTRGNVAVSTFRSLGVRTLINARGTYTIISGSRALDCVAAAMVEATNHYVHLDELMTRVGERLAGLTGAEWGYVSSGAAAALAEVTAASIAGADPERMARLPDTTGMRNEVIMQAAHRNTYDHAIRMTGARIVEVETVEELEAAFNDKTALVAVTGDQAHRGKIPVQAMIDAARRHGIPCLVDAAAERPDVPNRYLEMGADAVTYSGGKCLRGPQASGLVLGRKDLLWAAFLNAAPHHGLGRPMKAGKEEIMGLLAAVEAWVRGRDHDAEWQCWEGYLARIRTAVEDLPSVETAIEQPGISNVAPTLTIRWNPEALQCTPQQIHQELLDGEPSITVHVLKDGLRIMPYMMEEGDDAIIAARLRELMGKPHVLPAPSVLEPARADVSGEWAVDVRYVFGCSAYTAALTQEGNTLRGELRTPFTVSPIEGTISGSAVTWGAVLGYESSRTRYAFTGEVTDGVMRGVVTLGEYGTADWVARPAKAAADA